MTDGISVVVSFAALVGCDRYSSDHPRVISDNFDGFRVEGFVFSWGLM
jgi:hypothetical protein